MTTNSNAKTVVLKCSSDDIGHIINGLESYADAHPDDENHAEVIAALIEDLKQQSSVTVFSKNDELSYEKKLELRRLLCDYLIKGWHGNWNIGRVVSFAFRDAKIENDDIVEVFALTKSLLKSKKISNVDKVQTYIANNMKSLNEALWAGRPNERCQAIAYRTVGSRLPGVPLQFSPAQRDRKFDWKTVK